MTTPTADLMESLLTQRARQTTRRLTQELHTFFSYTGCDPHCHFCLEPLKVGDEFGFKLLKPGIAGTACAQCILENRSTPTVELERAEVQRATPQLPAPRHLGFLLFD